MCRRTADVLPRPVLRVRVDVPLRSLEAALPTMLTPDHTTDAGGSAATVDTLDQVHDLLVRLTDDPLLAARSLEEVVRRTVARIEDGVNADSSPTTLTAAAYRLVAGLAAADRVSPTVAAITDLAVLDLIVRRGLPLTTVSEVTGVTERELNGRRARAAARLAEADATTEADAERRYAWSPLVPAPAPLHQQLDRLLADATPPSRAPRPLVRTVSTVATAALALAALAVWTPRLVSESRSGPDVVEAVPSEFVPEVRPIADLADTSDDAAPETTADGDAEGATSEDALLTPDQDER